MRHSGAARWAVSADDDDRAPRVGGEVLADRAEQHSGKACRGRANPTTIRSASFDCSISTSEGFPFLIAVRTSTGGFRSSRSATSF